jgi:thymidylate kinase
MLIILEGVDGAGKSTLAAAIKRKIELEHPQDVVEYIHASQITGTVFEEYVDPLEDYIPGTNRHIIIDRWHVGELIYGPLYRNGSQFDVTPGSYAWVEMFLAAKGARLWSITQPLEVLQARLLERGEDYLQDNHVDYVRKAFSEKTRESFIFANEVSPDSVLTDAIVEHILLDAEYAEFRAASFKGYGITSYIGMTYSDPQTVLVLDNKAKNVGFNPLKSEDAALVLDKLRYDFLKEVAVVSSVSQTALAELLERLSMSGVVVYSQTVSSRLELMSIPHVKVDEPSDDRMYPVNFYQAAEKAQDLE